MKSSQNTEDTEIFFNQWAIYQQVIGNNYMAHDEIALALKQFLRTLAVAKIDFLDLGCGDAFMAAKVLQGLDVDRYCGVDLSPTALQLAQTNLQSLTARKQFINHDLALAITGFCQEFNIIFAGFSVHHLQAKEKAMLFQQCAKALKPNSHFLLYDLVRLESETRGQCLDRHWQHYRQWVFPGAELESIKTHIFAQDYAESAEALWAMADTAGFKKSQALFVDQLQLFAVYSFSN